MGQVAGLPTEIWEKIGEHSELPERLALTSTNQRMAELREQPELWPEVPTTTPDVPTHNSIRQAYWIHGQDSGYSNELGRLPWRRFYPILVMVNGERQLVTLDHVGRSLQIWNLETNQAISSTLAFYPNDIKVLSVAPLRIGIRGPSISADQHRRCHIYDAQLTSLGSIPLVGGNDYPWPCPTLGNGHLHQSATNPAHRLIQWRQTDTGYQSHPVTSTAHHQGSCRACTLRLGDRFYYVTGRRIKEHGMQTPYNPAWTLPQTVHHLGPEQINGVRFGQGWLVLLRSAGYGEGSQTYDAYRVWLKDDGTCQVLSIQSTPWRPLGLSEKNNQLVETYFEHRGRNDYRIQEVTPFPPAEESVNSLTERMLVWGKWATFASALISLRLTWRHCPLYTILIGVFIVGGGLVAVGTQKKEAVMASAVGAWGGTWIFFALETIALRTVTLSARIRRMGLATLCTSTWAASYCFAIDSYNKPSPIELSDVFSPLTQEPDTP